MSVFGRNPSPHLCPSHHLSPAHHWSREFRGRPCRKLSTTPYARLLILLYNIHCLRDHENCELHTEVEKVEFAGIMAAIDEMRRMDEKNMDESLIIAGTVGLRS